MSLDDDVKAVANTGGIFQSTLAHSLKSRISANNERRVEIESVMGNHETLRKDHDTFQASAEFQTGSTLAISKFLCKENASAILKPLLISNE